MAAVGVAGCSSGGKGSYTPVVKKPLPPAKFNAGEELSAFPLAVGNQWVYEGNRVMAAQGGKNIDIPIRFTLRVKEVKDVEGGKEGVLEVVENDVITGLQVWRVDKLGVYQVGITDNPNQPMKQYSPPQPALLFAHQDGKQEFKYTGTGPTPLGTNGTAEIVSKVVDSEEVDTNMGRMSALRIESVTLIDKNKAMVNTISWFSPKVGLVRFKQQTAIPKVAPTVTTLMLSSFTVK